jgi:hypothetical protein
MLILASSSKISGTDQPQQEPSLSLGPRSSPEEFADDEATLRGTPLLPTSLRSSPAIPELSPSFPASQQSSDSEEATLRGTPLLPTSLRSSPAIPELSPSFPASQQSSDSKEDDTQAGSNVSETTYSSVGRRTWDAGGGMGKDARIRKGKVGRGSIQVLRRGSIQVLRITGGAGVRKPCPRGGQSARPIREKRTRAQIRRANRLGPEGLGDRNDVDDAPQELEEGENETNVPPQCEPGPLNQQSSASVPVPEEPILSDVAVNVISALASVARDCIQESSESGIISNVHAVVAVLQGPELTVRREPHISTISLAALAARCKKSELLEACAHLSYWLSVLLFACGMSRWVLLYTLAVGFLQVSPF